MTLFLFWEGTGVASVFLIWASRNERALAAGGTSVIEPKPLERWNVTVAMVADPDGYQLEILERNG